MVYQTFVVSHPLFQGFECNINIEPTTTNSDIVANLIQELSNTFHRLGFEVLQRMLEKTDFHIHEPGFRELLQSNSDQTLYICGHLHNNSVDAILGF
jgi:hypothetical protein